MTGYHDHALASVRVPQARLETTPATTALSQLSVPHAASRSSVIAPTRPPAGQAYPGLSLSRLHNAGFVEKLSNDAWQSNAPNGRFTGDRFTQQSRFVARNIRRSARLIVRGSRGLWDVYSERRESHQIT